jgi:hypothetical protein
MRCRFHSSVKVYCLCDTGRNHIQMLSGLCASDDVWDTHQGRGDEETTMIIEEDVDRQNDVLRHVVTELMADIRE